MSQEAVERFMGRLVTDAGFRCKAAESLEDACRNAGYLLTAAELLLLSTTDVQRFAELGDGISAGLRRAELNNFSQH
ncbi:MAG: hypothetical protein J0665_13670 [Deltaproteobacteria bacterium]|jgi:hypothetical protein|nr:hypothetical protein [Deltaproteobacteria bacterium]